MKNKSLILISLLAFSFILTGCDILNTSISETSTSSISSSGDEETYYTVTFNPNNGEPTFTQEVVENKKATKTSDPVKEGHVFDGWFTHPSPCFYRRLFIHSLFSNNVKIKGGTKI
ncbi:MAG: InlB B-repeat-containing protein [Bacilli bacterium]